MLDMNDPLIALANAIDWKIFENEFSKFYSKDGCPAKPIRLMVGLLILKRLRTIVGILIRDISRILQPEQLVNYQDKFELFDKVRNQQIKDSNKVLSLHETHVYAITKGKDHKKYEYGTKASIVATKNSGVIVGVASHSKNEHDSKTLEAAISSANQTRTTPIKEAICDRGYRGVKEVLGTRICIPGTPLKKDSEYQKQKKREKFKRRATIEPIIGHLKSDFRLVRNYLKGFIGDEINLLLAATAWNLKKWINLYFFALFSGDIKLLLESISQIKLYYQIFLQLIVIKLIFNQL